MTPRFVKRFAMAQAQLLDVLKRRFGLGEAPALETKHAGFVIRPGMIRIERDGVALS